MRRITAAVSPFSVLTVGFTASLLLTASALAACAKDAAETASDDAGGSTIPDSFTYYDNAIPPSPPPPPPDPPPPPPPGDSGPPPPPTCGAVGGPCFTDNDQCPFFAFVKCEKSVMPIDAGSADGGSDAAPQPDGVCVGAFDIAGCSGGKCAGARCLLAADKCLQPSEVPCVCGDGGAGSPCGP